jgi:hypothetical protein
MKQRITVDDLQQLTDEQKQRLKEWWKPGFGVVFCLMDNDKKDVPEQAMDGSWLIVFGGNKINALPLLNCGQMIELLENNEISIGGSQFYDKEKDKVYNGYSVRAWFDNNVIEYRAIELADALWQAVKQVL